MSANSQTHIDDVSKCLNPPFLEVFPLVIISKGRDHTMLAVAYPKKTTTCFVLFFFSPDISHQNPKRRGEEQVNVFSNAMRKKPRLDDLIKHVKR